MISDVKQEINKKHLPYLTHFYAALYETSEKKTDHQVDTYNGLRMDTAF